MSTAKSMPTADRQARYEKQNGRLELTDRQARHIRKSASRLEYGGPAGISEYVSTRCCTM
jgi:hypothetical protein